MVLTQKLCSNPSEPPVRPLGRPCVSYTLSHLRKGSCSSGIWKKARAWQCEETWPPLHFIPGAGGCCRAGWPVANPGPATWWADHRPTLGQVYTLFGTNKVWVESLGLIRKDHTKNSQAYICFMLRVPEHCRLISSLSVFSSSLFILSVGSRQNRNTCFHFEV